MKIIHFKRLLDLADYLETKVPASCFNYKDFGVGDSSTQKLKCGTAGCALGWAPSVPSIRRAGLRWIDSQTIGCVDVNGNLKEYNDAAYTVFGIDEDDYNYLFMTGAECKYGMSIKTTPGEVAAKIRKFVKTKTSKLDKEADKAYKEYLSRADLVWEVKCLLERA